MGCRIRNLLTSSRWERCLLELEKRLRLSWSKKDGNEQIRTLKSGTGCRTMD
jgi:hypothetical protein